MDPVYSDLILKDIPFYQAPSSSSSRSSESYHISENSLYKAIELTESTHIITIRCEGVEDDFFKWLSGEGDYLPAMNLKVLKILDCPRFTSGALRAFLDARETKGRPLEYLEVVGFCPMMSPDDAAWFLGNETYVSWDVERFPNMPHWQDFIDHLSP